MANRLQDKVAIVTGGSVGIGRATWQSCLLKKGAKVVVANPSEAAGEECVAVIRDQGGEAIFVQTDISREEHARQASVTKP